MHSILCRKAADDVVAMLIHAPDQIVRYADIERSTRAAGQDVNIVRHLLTIPGSAIPETGILGSRLSRRRAKGAQALGRDDNREVVSVSLLRHRQRKHQKCSAFALSSRTPRLRG